VWDETECQAQQQAGEDYKQHARTFGAAHGVQHTIGLADGRACKTNQHITQVTHWHTWQKATQAEN
jgi:hypothetical protein